MSEEKVMSLKLTSGEEVIGKFVEQEGNAWKMKDVRLIIMMPDGQLSLGPILFSANKDHAITIYKTAIAVTSENVRQEFADAYTQSVSPLSVIKKSIIMG